MSSLKNKLSLKTFGLVYPFGYDFKCHYNTIAPGLVRLCKLQKSIHNLNGHIYITENSCLKKYNI